MKIDVSSVAIAIVGGCMLLGSCVFTSAQAVKNGLDSVANSLDHVARSVK
jgi:hypothetical protein